jgi:copper chaperone CopZ
MGHYLHVVPGRVRVKIPLIKGNDSRSREVERLLESVQGITSVSAYSLTGSVVVHYQDDEVKSGEILDVLKKNGYFDDSRVVTTDQYIQSAVAKAGQSIGKALFGLAIEKAFEGSGLSIIAALI